MELPEDFVPQLVALDLDDTTLSHDGTVDYRVADAIARVRAMGIHVVAATGRSLSTTVPVCQAAGIDEWAICSNGAMLAQLDPEQIVETRSFDAAGLLPLIEERVPDAMYAVEDTHGMFRTNKPFTHSALNEAIRVVPFDELLDGPVIRLVVRSEDHRETGLGHLAEELGLHSVVFGIGEVGWLDIGPQGVSKATMLADLCERLGVEQARTMAIGDSMNDIAMLRWAGVGVLMGHAHESMFEHADVVTGAEPGLGVAEALDAIRI